MGRAWPGRDDGTALGGRCACGCGCGCGFASEKPRQGRGCEGRWCSPGEGTHGGLGGAGGGGHGAWGGGSCVVGRASWELGVGSREWGVGGGGGRLRLGLRLGLRLEVDLGMRHSLDTPAPERAGVWLISVQVASSVRGLGRVARRFTGGEESSRGRSGSSRSGNDVGP